jgi:hypothetical protein
VCILIKLEKLKMKTLYHVQSHDPIWEATLLNKEILDDTTLVQPLKAAVDNKLKLSKNKKPTAFFEVEFRGHKWKEDGFKHAKRILNALNRSPNPQPITEDDAPHEILNWFKDIAPQLLELRKTTLGEQVLHNLAQVAEKGFRLELRKLFNVGVIDGVVAEGTMYETIQAQIYQQSGGVGKITRSNHLTIRNDGEMVDYNKATRNQGGKQGDLLIETDYLKIFTTNKAQTATKDGGGRTSEYETDLGGTLYKRSNRFNSKGYEIKDNKVILVVGMIDSRFFANNPHAVKLIQSRAGEIIGDTFLSDSATLAQFVNKINVLDILKDPSKIIKEAFDSLAVEV